LPVNTGRSVAEREYS